MSSIKRSAFTLIELLAVIAVIAVLMAILIPAIQSVRMSSLEAQGLSNIRQVGMAYLIAAQDRNGELPRYYDTLWWRPLVNNYLQGYPTDQPFVHGQSQWSDALFDPSAVARGTVHPEQPTHFAPLAQITEVAGNKVSPYRYILRHPHPDRQILLADNGASPAPDFHTAGDLYAVDKGNWEGVHSGEVSSRGDTPIEPGNSGPGNIRWFEETAKFFFLDGHVEKRHQSEVFRYNINPLYP